MSPIKTSVLKLLIIGVALFGGGASAEVKDAYAKYLSVMQRSAAEFAAEFARHQMIQDRQWLAQALDPRFVEALDERGLKIPQFFEIIEDIYFSEHSRTVEEEIGRPTLVSAKGDLVAIVPRRRTVDYGVELSRLDNAYILTSTNGGKHWKVFASDCSHQGILDKLLPGTKVDVAPLMHFIPFGIQVTASSLRSAR